LWISETTANQLLQSSGQTVANLRRVTEGLGQDEIGRLGTEAVVSMAVPGAVWEKVPVRHVIGHLPGRNPDLDSQLIIVLAQYDSPPTGPGETPYPAVNDTASSVAVMLEAIRTMQESGYQPSKTFLFIAYSGEGQEGGEWVNPPDVLKFLNARQGFSSAFDLEAVVHLRGVGAGTGDSLVLSAGGSLRLADLFETAAQQMGTPTQRAAEPVDLSIVFTERTLQRGGQEAPEITLNWAGWAETSHLPSDTLDTISADKLDQAGRALTLALMIMGRETQY
jgi:hypothetical protein